VIPPEANAGFVAAMEDVLESEASASEAVSALGAEGQSCGRSQFHSRLPCSSIRGATHLDPSLSARRDGLMTQRRGSDYA
jgi:hypothetical protein